MNKIKKTNPYYLIAGCLAILFAITHELNGQQVTLPALYAGNLEINTVTTFRYIWHVITAENFIFGIAFIIMAFYKEMKMVRFTARLISAILMIRLFVIVGTTLLTDKGQISDLTVDIVAIVVYTMIILLGTKVVSS